MGKFKQLINEHKKAALIALFLLIVFIGGSAISAMNVAQHRAEQAQSNIKKDSPAETEEEDIGKVALTDAQQEAINGYDEETENFIRTLAASIWSTGGGKYTLRFSNDSYVETINGKSSVHSYAITRIDKTEDGYGGNYYTAVVETDTGTHILSYDDGKGAAVRGTDTEKDTSTVVTTIRSASMFAQKDVSYERVEPVTDITIKGMNSDMTGLLDDSTDKLIEGLSSWCAVHYPTATEATWEKTAVIDYETGIISTNFTLNTETPASIAVTYNLSDKSYAFDL